MELPSAQSKMRNFLWRDHVGSSREVPRRRQIKFFAQANHPCPGNDSYISSKECQCGATVMP
ncbi:MAG TPA: hypothetical protein VFP79_12390, partial [Pseudolabrys sp.]|nr:hypothetical protein [Pseudolabrys sp.]